ncbi:HAD-IIA family hydrolase [Candidatus Omnitrophota bacterium]
MIKAIILATGIGYRLRPMTNNIPKCLVKTAGKPLLQYQLDAYEKAGVTDIYIVVGYEGQAIRDYCKHHKNLKITIIDNEIYGNTNNMYSLYLAKEFLQDNPFILNNADLVVSDELVSKIVQSEYESLIAVDVGSYNDESMKVSIDQHNKITDISKLLSKKDSYGCSLDFYKFSRESGTILFNEIENIIEKDHNQKDWTESALQRLFKRGELHCNILDISGLSWVEINDYDDLAQSDELFSQLNKTVGDYDHYCFDLDGTMYVSDNMIPGAVEIFKKLKKNGKTITFLSNNSSKNAYDYVEKLHAFGVDCDVSEIVISTNSAIKFLLKNNVKKIYVLGTESLQESVIEAGIELCTHDPEYVLIGYDTELSYSKLITASRLINQGVDLLATHCDNFCPSLDGPIPDVGAMLAMIEKTSGVKPKKIFGKPSPEMLFDACAFRGVEPKRTVMIGDRLYTDIKMAERAGIDSILVLTGETTRDMLEDSDIQPTYVLTSVSKLSAYI